MASRSWNRVELIGNLTRDPELRYTPNGAAVCTFGLATNRVFVTEGEKKEEVDFHRLVSWNKLAELCNQLLKKGSRVFVSGRLQTRSWEDASGQSRQTTEVVIEDMILLTNKSEGMGNTVSEDVDLDQVVPEKVKTPASEPQELGAAGQTEPAKEEPKEKEEPKAPTEEVGDEDLPF